MTPALTSVCSEGVCTLRIKLNVIANSQAAGASTENTELVYILYLLHWYDRGRKWIQHRRLVTTAILLIQRFLQEFLYTKRYMSHRLVRIPKSQGQTIETLGWTSAKPLFCTVNVMLLSHEPTTLTKWEFYFGTNTNGAWISCLSSRAVHDMPVVLCTARYLQSIGLRLTMNSTEANRTIIRPIRAAS